MRSRFQRSKKCPKCKKIIKCLPDFIKLKILRKEVVSLTTYRAHVCSMFPFRQTIHNIHVCVCANYLLQNLGTWTIQYNDIIKWSRYIVSHRTHFTFKWYYYSSLRHCFDPETCTNQLQYNLSIADTYGTEPRFPVYKGACFMEGWSETF